MSELNISEVQILPLKPKNGLVGFASVIINNHLYLGNIAIYSSLSAPEGFRLVFPSKVLNNGSKIDIAFPINKEAGEMFRVRIVSEYLKLLNQLQREEVM